ncbi:hypothetical protein DES52_110114 [Deinococcus yavapaiensis KR-236]|uniref:Uncharacterized protein n=1 Tax=Deinococcus yavapaiensis KR-236 TaxID=694435 RepID=A0A318S5Z7_9DEIO|nr:hypothetical protein DES52_110114 [Deinococcus yavapaiensis KR-236]
MISCPRFSRTTSVLTPEVSAPTERDGALTDAFQRRSAPRTLDVPAGENIAFVGAGKALPPSLSIGFLRLTAERILLDRRNVVMDRGRRVHVGRAVRLAEVRREDAS